ncbi:MAG TPA: hypothetical protein VMD28_10705 [Acidimicrobiales bacterium]|nr:hypothetical protein [Acidimicrobiales bacterium]
MIQLLLVACVALVAWIVVLGITLPRRYDAAHWRLAWVGFDVALLVGLAATAWAAWRRRAVIVLFATVTATLLCADAWFDITTARPGDVWLSATLAVCAELPGAIFLLWVVHRVVSYTRDNLWTERRGARPASLWSVEFTHPSEASQADEGVRSFEADPGRQ